MMMKLNEILNQYEKEVEIMDQLFKSNKEKPPISKNQPPCGGTIIWERSLFLRIKQTVLKFQTMEEMLASDQGKAVKILKKK